MIDSAEVVLRKIFGILTIVMALFGFASCGYGGETIPPAGNGNKVLIAYFSCTGTTESIAKHIEGETNGTLYEIVPEVPYTADDLKYYTNGRADKEQADPSARPAISGGVEDMEKYDVIFLGYPIWHGQAPRIVSTFLESYDFGGKHIYPVSQSASMDTSQYAQSVEFIKTCAPGAVVDDGLFSKDNSVIRSYIADTVI